MPEEVGLGVLAAEILEAELTEDAVVDTPGGDMDALTQRVPVHEEVEDNEMPGTLEAETTLGEDTAIDVGIIDVTLDEIIELAEKEEAIEEVKVIEADRIEGPLLALLRELKEDPVLEMEAPGVLIKEDPIVIDVYGVEINEVPL